MIPICIGSNPDGSDMRAVRVLQQSILDHASDDVSFTLLGDGSGTTGFSRSRWELCKMKDFSIYLDSDMLVIGDIAELWDYRLDKTWVGCYARGEDGACVSVVDCGDMPPTIGSLAACKLAGRYFRGIPEAWNCMDYVRTDTRLIHYTQQKLQPWKRDASDEDRDIDRIWRDYESTLTP